MTDEVKSISDGEKAILERAVSDPAALQSLVERYQTLLFGFILSFAAFSRDQAFQMTANAFTHCLSELRQIPRDGLFLEGLFRQALHEFEGVIPGGSADLTAFGDFPPLKKASLQIVREALIRLSPEEKAVILLRDQCHFSFERIAGILGVQPKQARSACLGARERFREAVKAVLEKNEGAS